MYTTTRMRTVCCLVFLLVVHLKVSLSSFSYGNEAKRLCQAYKKVCPRGKVCAVQKIQLPRPVKFPVCVHRYQVQVRSPSCLQAPSPGSCGAQFSRWYYNVHVTSCSWFTYSGCGGNDNNFRSREDCERICVTGHRTDNDVTDEEPRHDPANLRHPVTQRHHTHHQSRIRPDLNNHKDLNTHGSYYTKTGLNMKPWDVETIDQSSFDTNSQPYDSSNGDKSTFDTHGQPYIYTDWQDSREDRNRGINRDGDRNRKADGQYTIAHRAKQDLRNTTSSTDNFSASSQERRRIRFRARPRPHHHDMSSHQPAALQVQPINHHHLQDSLFDSSSQRSRVGLYNVTNRRRASFSDNSRNFNKKHFPGIATKVPTANIRRKLKGRGPPRTLSLLNKRTIVAETPARVQILDDVKSEMTSPLRSSYAPDASEVVRRVSSRRHRKRGRGLKKRNKRRRRKNRRRGWRYRNREKNLRRPKNTIFSNSTKSENTTQDFSHHPAPRRNKPTTFWPEKTQSDEANQNQPKTFSNKERRKRRRKRRRKGKERRQEGGFETRNSITRGTNTTTETGNQYYEKIHLFQLLGGPLNETNSST